MKKITLLAFMALALCACTKINEIEEQPVVPAGPNTVTFTAEFTKTATANDQTVTWVAGDEVKFVWAGGFATATASSSGASTSFTVEVAEGINEVYAVYPASAAANDAYSEGKVNVSIASPRPNGSFAANDICVAKAVKNGDVWQTSLTFKNVACLLKIDIDKNDGLYDLIQIHGYEKTENIAGLLPVNIDGSSVTFGEPASATQTMNLTISGPGTYYIPVLPGVTFENGFMIKLLKEANVKKVFYYNGSYTMERGKIIKFNDFDTKAGHYYVKPDGSGDSSGRNWSNAMSASKFKAFIENSGNHTLLRGATFHLSANSFNFGGYLKPNFNGHTVVNFTIQGMKQGSDSTIFVGRSGDDAGSLELSHQVNVTVKNVRFTNTSGSSNRAAIRVTKNTSTLNLENCYFDNNSTAGQGAAVNIINGANVYITNCEFKNNSATKGASIHVENAKAVIEHCTFKNNSGKGNALHIPNKGANVSMKYCDISGGNKCTVYGEDDGNTSASTVSFTEVEFHDNHAESESGAAAWLGGLGSYTFTDCDFINNHADMGGGAVCIVNGGAEVSFTGGKFQRNHADGDGLKNGSNDDSVISAGGAIYATGSGVTFDCTDVLFKENYTYVSGTNNQIGGIIRVQQGNGLARFNHCVFDGNYTIRNFQDNQAAAAIITCRIGGVKYYFNACEFKKNTSGLESSKTSDKQGGCKGTVIASYRSSKICMNNCSMHDNYGARDNNEISWIYVDNPSNTLLISNSTIVGDPTQYNGNRKNEWGVIKLHSYGYYYFINNILCSEFNTADSQTLWCGTEVQQGTTVYSYYNKTSPEVDGRINWGTDTGSGHDYFATSSYFGNWSKPYTWNGTLTGTYSGMKAATADVNTQIQSADADFHAWLNSIGALGKDINGNSRGATSWPGCYQN